MLAEGLGDQAAIGVGAATVVLSVLILLAWFALRQAPGLGTVLNALLVGVALGAVLEAVSTPDALVWRYAFVAGGILLVGLGSGLYLGSRLGAGPRDGLMLGLHRRTGVSVRLTRTVLEITVVAAGALLG
ncbi:MAG: YczE/YyaS/YitT family protein, partial [Solirubrobacteraceae bacterium]